MPVQKGLCVIRPFSLSEFANKSGGSVFGEDVSYSRVSIDSRECDSALFIALRGDRLDGHDFIGDAQNNGCAAVVIEDRTALNEGSENQLSGVLVSNTREALGMASALNREAFRGRVLALTGSSGKTTTKNMLASILSQEHSVIATEGNFNNEIGVPLTLLRIDAKTEVAVIEMGARNKGDIDYLGRLAKPDVAVVLNAGVAHLGEFGSYEAIVSTKGEIYDTIKPEGVAVINLDDPANTSWRERAKERRVFTFSIVDDKANLYARNIHCSEHETRFELVCGQQVQSVHLQLPGRHNVANAMAAAAMAIQCGCTVSTIAKGLGLAQSSTGRMTRLTLGNGIEVVDDSYNANPVSVKAALDVLALQSGNTIAVLGEMGELGDQAHKFHIEVARYAADQGIGSLYCSGSFAKEMAESFGEQGYAFASNESLSTQLLHDLSGPATVLVKGSRMTQMEQVIEMLQGGVH